MEVSPNPARDRLHSNNTLDAFFITLIIATVASFSIAYALIITPFMMPDEVAHADYAFALFDAGRPFTLHHSHPANYVTRQTRYLVNALEYRKLRYNVSAITRIPLSKHAIRQRIDATSPGPSGKLPRDGADIPYAMLSYPTPYYVLISAAMRLAYQDSHGSLIAAFFVGRLANVVYLVLTLCLVYLILLETTFTRLQRFALFIAIAFFPMTQWLPSYIQPDNQSALLMTLSIFLVLKLKHRPSSTLLLVSLSMAICALALTKLHYAAVMIATLIVAIGPKAWRRVQPFVFASATVLPIITIFSLPAFLSTSSVSGPTIDNSLVDARQPGMVALVGHNLVADVADAYVGGTTFDSFWFHIGIRSATAFRDVGFTLAALRVVLVMGTLLAILATIRRQIAVARRLISVFKRGKHRIAIWLAAGDVHLMVYLLLSVILFGLSAAANGYLQLQGRYWYPVLTSVFILVVRSLASLGPRRLRSQATTTVACLLAATSISLTPATFAAMYNDLYKARPDRPNAEIGEITSRTIRVGVLRFRGVVLDSRNGSSLREVSARIDEKDIGPVATGLQNERLAKLFNDPTLDNCGFALDVPIATLRPGHHHITFFAVESQPRGTLPIATQDFVTGPS